MLLATRVLVHHKLLSDGVVVPDSVTVRLGNENDDFLGEMTLPCGAFTALPDGTRPDFDFPDVVGGGRVIALGDYQVDVEWLLHKFTETLDW